MGRSFLAIRQLTAALLCVLAMSLARAAPEGETRGASARLGIVIRGGLPLDEALQELARQSGIQVVFFSRITAGRSAPELSGEYSLSDAMTRLLAGSGLTFRQVNARTVEVRQPPPGSARSSGKSRPGGNARRSKSAPASNEPMEEVQVIATAEQLVATRIPTPLSEIPQSISIISSEQIRQQNAFDLGDVMSNTPGIATRRETSLDESAYSRAFQVTSYHVDGGGALKPELIPGLNTYLGAPDMSEFDHVEVLRGSDALFTGNSNPGGTVSLVRKRPLPMPALQMTATLGSWNNYRMELDANSPLTDDGSLRARADAVYAKRDYFFDRAHLERKKIFAALEYDFTPTATLTAGATYQWDDALPVVGGLPLYTDGRDPHLPRNTALTFDWALYNTRWGETYLQYRQQFDDHWTLRLNAAAGRTTVDYGLGSFGGSTINPRTLSLGTPSAGFSVRPMHYTLGTADLTLTGVLNWLGLREEIAIGGDFTRVRARQVGVTYFGFGPPLVDVRTFDPSVYPDPRGTRPPDLSAALRSMLEQYGAFVSLRVDLPDGWSAMAGARIASDTLRMAGSASLGGFDFGDLASERGSSDVVTPFGALLYRIDDHFTWYSSYADVYLSQTSRPLRANGEAIGPAHGVNLESGIKGVWRDGALNASLAVYRITQRHVPVNDTAPPPPGVSDCCYVSGTVRSRGVELELDGELARGWLIGSGYTYNANKTAADGGIPANSTPRHLLKIWTSNRLPGAFSRWTVGGSLRAQTAARGNRLLTCNGQFQDCAPSEVVGQHPYAVSDLRAGFEVDSNWQVALSLNNVLDKRYYLSHNTPAQVVWYGEPRNFMVRIDGKY
ncbi:MAG: TonB-dependent receptor [Gammaproteobacteria bacterium]